MPRSRELERMLELVVSIVVARKIDDVFSLVAAEMLAGLRATTAVGSLSHHFVGREIRLHRVDVWTPSYVGRLTPDQPEWARAAAHPLTRHYGRTRDRAPRTVSDIVDGRTWRTTPLYDALRRTSGAIRHIAIPLYDLGGADRGFVLGRDGRDFSDSERTYARRVQQLLSRLSPHLRELGRWQRLAVEPEVATDLRLTPRELTVLVQLADGLTAQAIAHRLGISVRTVHRHLDNLYRKIGASDRLEAVLRAQHLGLLP